jgi:hypothetical protein
MVRKGDYNKIIKVILLVLTLIICFFLVYKIHFAYPYEFINPESATLVNATPYPFPLHNDEWTHLALGLAIAEEHKTNFNPYLGTPTQDREKGFHLLLATLFRFPMISPVLFYQLLAPIFLAVNALFLFLLVSKLIKNYWAGLFSIFFFASIKSNMNLLGNWFFIPLTFTLFLVFLYFYLFTKALEGSKKSKTFMLASMLVFVVAILIYPFAAVLASIVSSLYTLSKLGFVKKNLKYVVFFGILGFIISVVFVKLYFWTGTILGTAQKFLGEMVFEKGWAVLEHSYSLLSFYGIIPSMLVVLGIIYLLLKKKNLLFILWPAVLFLNLVLFMLFGFSLFLPYQRNLFYLLVSLAPLSAMGLYWLSELLVASSKKYIVRNKKYSIALAVLLVAIVLFFTFKGYYKIEPQEFSLHRIMTFPEYEALLWLKEHYEPYQKVLAKPFLSVAVYPVSMNRVVGMMPSSLEGGAYGRIYDFFKLDCKAKQIILGEEKVDFVITQGSIDCDFITNSRVYYKDGITLYKVT